MSEILTWLALLEMLGGKAAAPAGPPGPPGPPGGATAPPVSTPVPTPAVMPPPGDIGPPPAAAPVPTAAPLLIPTAPVAPPVSPGALPPMPPWPSPPTPGSLPPFPGPGWVPDTPVTPAIAARAAYWNPQLWNYATKTIVKQFVQEQFGGSWVTFTAAWHPGTAGPKTYMATEAWRLAGAPPLAPPAPSPVPVAPGPVATPATAPMAKPGPVGPEPAPGAWQTNAAYITRYQSALTWLAQQGAGPYDTQGVDGKYGPHTDTAVRAFQLAHALAADGQAGPATAAMLDAAMGYTSAATPPPGVPVAPGPAAPVAPAPAPGPLPPPPVVLPYPGTGAWQSNAAYIARYQSALTWLAQQLSSPAYDPHGVDGKYGPNTGNAVKAFETAHGLAADGQCGPATAAAIDAAVAALGGHG